MTTPIDMLCKDFPKQFQTYFEYCRSLRFEDKPDYSYLKRLFKDLFANKGMEMDHQFDWCVQNHSSRGGGGAPSRENIDDSKKARQRERSARRERDNANNNQDHRKVAARANDVNQRRPSGRGGEPRGDRHQSSRRRDSGVSRGSRDRTRRDQTRSSSNAQQRDHTKYPAPRISTTQRNAGVQGDRRLSSRNSGNARQGLNYF